MKRIRIIIVSVCLATLSMVGIQSCINEPNVKDETTKFQVGDEINKVHVLTIDSCEYFYGPWGSATVLTHKGNCKNPIHKK